MTTNALAPLHNPNVQITEVGLLFRNDLTLTEWLAIGETRHWIKHKWLPFAFGDWLLYGEGRGDWGEMYAQAIEVTGKEYGTLADYVWVAKAVPPETRNPDKSLSWTHHKHVAFLHKDPERQRDLLDYAVTYRLYSSEFYTDLSELRAEVRNGKEPQSSERAENRYCPTCHQPWPEIDT